MKKLYFLLFLSLSFLASAQNPGDVAQNFGKSPGFNGTVNAIAAQADSKILVGGSFTTYNGVTENRIIRLNADGTKDTSFNIGTGFDGTVYRIALKADGKILVGGDFTTYNGVTENRIICLNADGSKDTSFTTGTGFDSSVRAIVLQADGKILVGGAFITYNETTENRIIRLNADGSKDTSFTTGTGFNITIFTIAAQADGKILVGGDFTTYKGVTENRIIRLNADGSKDASFNTGTGFTTSTVNTIVIQSDGKILVGGTFSIYNGVTENRMIRLNTDGSKDTSFTTGTGFNNIVNAIAAQADAKILVGGAFTTYNGAAANRIIRLNADGTKDTSFNTGTGFNNNVNIITTQSDGKILFGGIFTTYKGTTENRIIRLNADGSKDTSFNTGTGFNNTVIAITTQSDGKIIVGGNFTTYQGTTENRIIRLNTDGSKDTSFNTGTGFNNPVYAITIKSDGKILIGGGFFDYQGTTEIGIIRLNTDGSKDTSFVTSTGFDGSVQTIATQSDGKILVGGSFSIYQGTFQNSIIRLNTDGSKDTSFDIGTSFNGFVNDIIIQSDGKIIVGGNFTTYQGTTENRIIRLNTDGSKDTSFNTGTGFNNPVYAITIKSDGKILVGGDFITYKGDNSSAYLIGLHSEQSLSTTSFDAANAFVIYPNPAQDVLHLQSNNFTSIKAVKIYDLQGKVVLQDTNDIINVSNLSKGLYIVKISTEEGEFTKKFIKE